MNSDVSTMHMHRKVVFIYTLFIICTDLILPYSAHQIADELLTDTAATVTATAATEIKEEDDSVNYETVYHYVTYIYKNGYLWEMNGLDYRPKKICPCNKQDWLKMAEPSVQKRMADKT